MANFADGKRYDTDWNEIDDQGNQTGAGKNWQANYDSVKASGGDTTNFSPEVMSTLNTGGAKPATPAASGGAQDFAWDNPGDFSNTSSPMIPGGRDALGGMKTNTGGAADWSTNPYSEQAARNYTPAAGPSGQAVDAQPSSQSPTTPGGQGALEAQAPQLDAAALMSQLQGPSNLQQLGPAPTVAAAGPLSSLGQNVQSSIQSGLAEPSVDTNSPAYQAQVAMNQRNAQRAAERNRAGAAARMNAQGTLGSGGFDATVNRINQDQGRQEQDFEAALMQSELNAGRDRQARAQQLGAGLLSQEQQQSLSERLANQSAAMTGMGMNNQRDLANQGTQMQTLGLNNQRDLTAYGAQNQRDLTNYGGQLQTGLANQGARLTQRGYNLQKYLGDKDLGLRETDMSNRNSQFYDQLAQQLGLSTAQMNQQAMLSLLGGG